MKNKQREILSKILNFYTIAGSVIIVIATVLILSPLYPYIIFQLDNQALAKEQTNVTNLVNEIDEKKDDSQNVNTKLPDFDPTLTTNNTLLIPSIGVVGKIHENSNPSKGLENGVWRVGEWGTPDKNSKSIILASHRFGYLTWSNKYRKENSFLNLPKTKVGDRVEIIWEQRRYIFEIYKSQEGTKITDYNADLILYTCKTLNSDIRVFRYAKRIN